MNGNETEREPSLFVGGPEGPFWLGVPDLEYVTIPLVVPQPQWAWSSRDVGEVAQVTFRRVVFGGSRKARTQFPYGLDQRLARDVHKDPETRSIMAKRAVYVAPDLTPEAIDRLVRDALLAAYILGEIGP